MSLQTETNNNDLINIVNNSVSLKTFGRRDRLILNKIFLNLIYLNKFLN